MTFGSDSLFSDKANTKPGQFEQQIDIYTPPYLHQKGARPELAHAGLAEEGSRTVRLGDSISFKSKDADRIKKMRLIRPSSFTHVTNVEQSSVALDFEKTKDGLTTKLPDDPSLVTPGWWMVTAVDGKGVPSKSVWLKVPPSATAVSPTTTPISP
jgi:hypothetical protein